MTPAYPYSPDRATPPGWTLEETLAELSMSQAELARRARLRLGGRRWREELPRECLRCLLAWWFGRADLV